MLEQERWRTYYQMMLGVFPADSIYWRHPAGSFYSAYRGTIFAWDQFFDAIVQMYMGLPSEYTRTALEIILSHQKKNGHSPRSVRGDGTVYHKHWDHSQPFLCQSALLLSHRVGGAKWLEKDISFYDKLKKYLDYWLDHEDRRGAGLSVWQYTGATGMDNLHERAGRFGEDESFCEGADLNSYLVRECRAMALLAEMIGRTEDVAGYRERAEKRVAAIRKWLWNEEDGMFYDYHAREERPIKVKCVSAFAPLWARAADSEQAERLVREHLLNPEEFYRPYRIPALAASEPGYVTGYLPGETGCSWRAFVWAPTNYYVFQGLRNYGYDEEARDLAENSEDLLHFNQFCEYYSSEHGTGTGRKPFTGWTGLFMFMRRELELGVDPTILEPINQAGEKMRQHLENSM